MPLSRLSLADLLFRAQLYESELRCARIEAEVRLEMADEMAERLYEVERRYTQRLQADTLHNEDFVNRKIDLLVRAGSASATAGTETPRRKMERLEALEVEATLAALPEESVLEEDESRCEPEESEASIQLQPGPLDSSGILAKRLARMSVNGDVSLDSISSEEDEEASRAPEQEESVLEEAEAGEISIDVDEDEDSQDSQEESEEEDASDESFDVSKEADSSIEAPVAPRRSAAARSSTKPAARSSARSTRASALPLTEQSQSRSLATSGSYASVQSAASDDTSSDASLIHVPDKTPRKKRTLRGKATDEVAMLEQIGDTSLVEALQRSSSTSGLSSRRGLR